MKQIPADGTAGPIDLATITRQQDEVQRAQDPATSAKSEVFVYVLDMTLAHEYGWMSVHQTYEGAVARLEAKVREYDLWDEYRAVLARDFVAHADAGPVAAGDEDDTVHWGISHLPVEA